MGILAVIAIVFGLMKTGHFISAGDSEKLVQSATAQLAKNPRSVEAYQLRAQGYLNLKLEAQAKQDLETALQIDANNPELCYQLAGVLENSDKNAAMEYRKKGDALRMSGYRAKGFYKPADSSFWWVVGLLMLVPLAILVIGGKTADKENPDDYKIQIPTKRRY